MNLALSPYDRMVVMPVKTSEKLMRMGDRVTLWFESAHLHPPL
jgi:hypothetical protein